MSGRAAPTGKYVGGKESNMATLQLAGGAPKNETRQAEREARVRCACERCGAHLMATRSWHLTGSCQNCGSFALRALEPASGVEPVGASSAASRRLVRSRRDVVDAQPWAIQDSNLGPLPYQRSALTD